MTFTLNEYENNRQEVLDRLSQLLLLLEEMGLQEQTGKVRELKEDLLQEHFQIAVVGEFNRGKSTFINALLGTRLLPSANKPTTAILNQITYAREPVIELYYHNTARKPEPISEQHFHALVALMEPLRGDRESERQYEAHAKRLSEVSFARIGYPLEFLKEGVLIIDTPGTNDLDPAREQITNNIIPKSDAAILLLAANKILSDSEMSLLRDRLLSNDIQKVFLVVNFKDMLLTEMDQKKVLEYATDKLKPIIPSPRLFMVSTKYALNARRLANGESLTGRNALDVWAMEDTGLPEFERALADFLQYERGAVKLQKPIDRALKHISKTLEESVAFEKTALTVSIEDVSEKVEAFKPRVAEAKTRAQGAVDAMQMDLRKSEEEINRWYDSVLRNIADHALKTFDQNRSLPVEDIRRKVEDSVAPMERDLFNESKKKTNEAFKSALERASKILDQERLKLQQGMSRITGIQTKEDDSSGFTLALKQAAAASVRTDFFEDVLEDLYGAWDNHRGVIGKIFIGAGVVLTHLIQGLFSWLFGAEDPKQKMRDQLAQQYQSMRQEKKMQLQKEWKALEQFARQEVSRIVQESTDGLERQLQTLQSNAGLEKAEAERKMDTIIRREHRLQNMEQSLTGLLKTILDQQKKVRV